LPENETVTPAGGYTDAEEVDDGLEYFGPHAPPAPLYVNVSDVDAQVQVGVVFRKEITH
jgi:hypothetical protein